MVEWFSFYPADKHIFINVTAVTLGQGHQKVIQYIFPDLYFLWPKYLRISWNSLAWEAKVIVAEADLDAAAETNWKHKVTRRLRWLNDETPISRKPYPVPLALREAVGKQIKDLIEIGVIRESNLPWAFPIIVVRKKNGKLRICVDYRQLNDRSEKSYWPFGSTDDIFASLGGARYLSSLDMANAYHHIPLV